MGRKPENWIRIHRATLEKNELDNLADFLGIDIQHTMGCLSFVWLWADTIADEDAIINASVKRVDLAANREGFFAAMVKVGWAKDLGDGRIQFPGLQTAAARTQKDSLRPSRAKKIPTAKGARAEQSKAEESVLPPDGGIMHPKIAEAPPHPATLFLAKHVADAYPIRSDPRRIQQEAAKAIERIKSGQIDKPRDLPAIEQWPPETLRDCSEWLKARVQLYAKTVGDRVDKKGTFWIMGDNYALTPTDWANAIRKPGTPAAPEPVNLPPMKPSERAQHFQRLVKSFPDCAGMDPQNPALDKKFAAIQQALLPKP